MSNVTYDRQGAALWCRARLATCDAAMTVVHDGALVTRGGRIEWLGEMRALQETYPAGAGDWEQVHDLDGAWVTPGLIDCHTHLVFAGTRAVEYGERLRGVSYEDIAARGGGILSSMRAVRQASLEELCAAALPRLVALQREGVMTVEIKSGYGLTREDEAKMLRAARILGRRTGMRVRATFLAAHTLPPEYAGRPDEYIDVCAQEWLPALHAQGLVDAVDIFCEHIGFSAAQAGRLFAAARALGVPVKMHAEQLSNIGGTLLATRHGALSCDHLEEAGEAEALAMARTGTVAVLLPLAYYCMRATRAPPVEALRRCGTAMAVATDCNPGSAPGVSLLLAMNMATRLFGLTPGEALAGVTRHAARALGLQDEAGTLAPGMPADFVAWRIDAMEELSYWIGFTPGNLRVQAGRVAGGYPDVAVRQGQAPATASGGAPV